MSAPDNLVDITPEYKVEALLRMRLKLCEERGYKAALFVAMKADGELDVDMCGAEKRDVLWALEQMKLTILEED